MTEETRRLRTSWESFTSGGRAYLRAEVPDPERPGATFSISQPIAGRYLVEELFAAGETTVLLFAVDLKMGRPVATKALRSDWFHAPREDPDNAARLAGEIRRARHLLQAERRLLVRLRNAGCNAIACPVDYVYDRNPALGALPVDEFVIANEPYLVLQRIVGRSLEEVLATEFPSGMDESLALGWMLPIVKALAVLHEPWRLETGRTWHCVYQDLKPANIIIDPLGRPSLLDFGGCQVVVDGVPVLEGSSTAGYCPPEAEGPSARVLLPCADVYAIGSTLHHMLTGVDPRVRLASQGARSGGPIDLREFPPRCSPGVRNLLDRCLAPRPSDRLADAHRVGEILEALIEA